MHWKRIWLCVPPLLLFACDLSVTLLHQPADYWQGDYASAHEGNPLAFAFMLLGPAVFVPAALMYGLGFAAVVVYWRHSFAPVLAFLLTLGHGVGASTWLATYHGIPGWVSALALLIGAERLLELSWTRSGIREAKTGT